MTHDYDRAVEQRRCDELQSIISQERGALYLSQERLKGATLEIGKLQSENAQMAKRIHKLRGALVQIKEFGFGAANIPAYTGDVSIALINFCLKELERDEGESHG